MNVHQESRTHFSYKDAQSKHELSRLCAMSTEELDQTVHRTAHASRLRVIQTAHSLVKRSTPLAKDSELRLAVDLKLDLFTVALLLSNFRRIENLEREVYALGLLVRSGAAPGSLRNA